MPGKLLREAQTTLAQQQTTTANARQQLVNLGFSATKSTRWSSTRNQHRAAAGNSLGRHHRFASGRGAFVDRNAPLFAVTDLGTMWVYLNLYESDLGRVKSDKRLRLSPTDSGRAFTGKSIGSIPRSTRDAHHASPRRSRQRRPLLRANMYGAEKSSSKRRTKGS